ncbi:MAG: MotA/TolQ/ExbB proton channel family protein [Phycisphaerales bacterium JB039]
MSIPGFCARLPLFACAVLLAAPAPALAQEPGSVWGLFRQSFDLFTVLLVAGSVGVVWVSYLCALDLRERRILPEASLARMSELVRGGRRAELVSFVSSDSSFPARVLQAALDAEAHDAESIRETAEIAASEQCARWFRRVEPLSLIGNLGPLIGLAGTVWGMILAFTELGATAGAAGPEELAPGIAKALFHTLLGLMLAIPALGLFGLFRARADRICNRGLRVSGDLVERLIRAEQT